MNDRELLELAARAAGVGRNRWDYDEMRRLGHMVTRRMMWNPLADNSDALWLLAKLRIDIQHLDTGLVAAHRRTRYSPSAVETYGEDECAATRRAITRAAAEIGKNMGAA